MSTAPKPWYQRLYIQVLIGITLGIMVGSFYPSHPVGQEQSLLAWAGIDVQAQDMRFFSDLFLALLKMLIGVIIFCTILQGVADISEDRRKLGIVSGKAMLYFFVITLFSLIIGMLVAHIIQPGSGFNVDPASLTIDNQFQNMIDKQTGGASEGSQSLAAGILNFIPQTLLSVFVTGNTLQVLFIAVFVALAVSALPREQVAPIINLNRAIAAMIFKMVHKIMLLAPLAAFGAMAYTIGKYGFDSLWPMLKLVLTFYGTSLLFVALVLGGIARFYLKISIWSLVRFLRQELLIILGTCSSETVLPNLLEKSEKIGCPKSITGIVVPAGYSFNLDGSSIAMTLTLLFVAQALNIDLTWWQQIQLLGLCIITSKGAAGVVGSAMLVMISTLMIVDFIPVAGLMLVLGVDRFMSESRALVNYTGNALAVLVISKWQGELDEVKMRRMLGN